MTRRTHGGHLLRVAAVAAVILGCLPGAALAAVQRQVLSHPGYVSRWSYLESPTTARTAPRASAPAIMHLGLWTQDGTVIFRARVGTGKPTTPTPHGQFYIRDKLTGFRGDGMYGPVAFGTSALSNVETDWPRGGIIGIHGTNEPNLVPGHPSHGCVRLHNADILALAKLLPVGTPLTIK